MVVVDISLSNRYHSPTHRCSFFILLNNIALYRKFILNKNTFYTHLTLNVVFLPLVFRTPPPWTALNARRRHSPGARWSRTIRSCSSRSFLASTNTESLVKHGMNVGYTFFPVYFPLFCGNFLFISKSTCGHFSAFFFFFQSLFFFLSFSDFEVDRLTTS